MVITLASNEVVPLALPILSCFQGKGNPVTIEASKEFWLSYFEFEAVTV